MIQGAERGRHGAAVAAAFAAMVLLQAAAVLVPVRRDERPLSWDPAVHMRAAWKYRAAAADGRWSDLLRPPHAPGHPPYPPLAHLAMAGGAALAGPLGLDVEDGAALANVLFLMLLGWAAYLLAADWWGEWAGVAAAYLAAFLPPLVGASRTLLVDVALTAAVAMAYAAWSRSRGFSLWGWTLSLGAAMAAGMLVKWTFFLYILPILAHAGWTFLRPHFPQDRWRAAAAGLIAAAAALPWYAANAVNVAAKVSRAAGLGAQEGDPTRGLDALFYYLVAARHGLGWAGLLAAAAGLAWLLVWRTRNGWTLAAWFVSSYAVWTCVSNKDPRYMFPALPALALAAAGLPVRAAGALAVLLTAVTLWTGLRDVPRAPAWPLADVLRYAAQARRDPAGAPAVLTVLANHERMNGNNLVWTAEREGLDRALTVRSRSSGLGELTEFVLVKTGDLGPARTVQGHEQSRAEALRPDGWFQRTFERASSWPLPDGSEASLYRRRPAAEAPAVRMIPAAALGRLLPRAEAEGLRGSCGGEALAEGEADCELAAEALRLDGLVVKDLRVALEGLRLAADDEGRPRLLGLRRLKVLSARVGAADAAAFLAARVKGLEKARVRFLPGGGMEAAGRLRGAPVRAALRLELDASARAVRVEVLSARVLGLPLPVRRSAAVSLAAGRGRPFEIALRSLKTDAAADVLEVSP